MVLEHECLAQDRHTVLGTLCLTSDARIIIAIRYRDAFTSIN